ncbi:MAG TPA: DNA repair protein RecN [Elusimicrobiota bacterium]|nr:DNA repair protein RecN [Elusimicrobiota bacterium]
MLLELSIKNFALIESLELEFSPGLNVLTGETGAGKSIVVESLGLVLGDRASTQEVRTGASRMTVSGVFRTHTPRLRRLLDELDISSEDDPEMLRLRRDVDASGRSRCFVNDTPVNLATLSRLGDLLVDIHGQHEHQLLLRPAEQMEILDSYGRLEKIKTEMRDHYVRWKDLSSEQAAISLSEQERAQRIDLYRFQLDELKAARLQPDEEDRLEQRVPQLKNAERLKSLLNEAYDCLYGNDGAASGKVRRVQRILESLQNLGIDVQEQSDMIQESVIRLEETAHSLDALRQGASADPAELDAVLSRLDLIAKLKRKYGPTVEQIMQYQQKISEELDRLEHLEERTQNLSQNLAVAEKDMDQTVKKLRQARVQSAEKMARLVEKEFSDLGLSQARFGVSVTPDLDEEGRPRYSGSGGDKIHFTFSANPGEEERLLSEVASGGELSRVMLSIKTVISKEPDLGTPTLVFDEVDSGVGGSMGIAIAKKLNQLSKTHQILCITHVPQIAASAMTHFHVEKNVHAGRTATRVRTLSKEDRIEEVARMLGGGAGSKSTEDLTPVSVQHARELLASGKK